MRFIFLRHSEYNQPQGVPSALLPHPITNEGKNQAVSGAQKLIDFFNGKEKPTRIICSSLLRAYQTAQVLSSEFKKAWGYDLKIEQTDELVERKLGAMANLTVADIESAIVKDSRFENPPKGWKSSRNYKLPYIDAESLKEAGLRVYNKIQSEYSNELTIFIGHGASFRNASIEFGVLEESDLPKLSMHYAEPLIFEEKSGNWKLIFGNWKIREKKDKID